MIRLQNHGRRNHPYWWIVVQPKNKCFKGRIIERVGLWIPRKTSTVDRSVVLNKYKLKYWLSVGATPTESVHRLLTYMDLVPKHPVPFGSKSLYEKKEKSYPMDYFHAHRWGFNSKHLQDTHHYDKMRQMETLLEDHINIHQEALNE